MIIIGEKINGTRKAVAQAARNTASFIDDTVNKVQVGSELVQTTSDTFDAVSRNTEKVTQVVGEIATTSNEPALRVEQVNAAVSEIEKVTQQVAATEEKSASSSVLMNTQADRMKQIVADLVNLVGRKETHGENESVQEEATEFLALEWEEQPPEMGVHKDISFVG